MGLDESVYFWVVYLFWKELVRLFYKSLLPFLLSWFLKNLTVGLFHNFCPFFDVMFAQLGVISKTRRKIIEIVAVTEHYLVITHEKWGMKEAAVPNIPSRKTSWWKNVNKKGCVYTMYLTDISIHGVLLFQKSTWSDTFAVI